MQPYYVVGYLIGILAVAAIGTPIGRYLVRLVGGFRPSLRMIALSTFLGYGIGAAIAFAISLVGGLDEDSPLRFLGFLVFWVTLSLAHNRMLVPDSGDRLSILKSAVIALLQILAVIFVFLIALFALGSVIRSIQ